MVPSPVRYRPRMPQESDGSVRHRRSPRRRSWCSPQMAGGCRAYKRPDLDISVSFSLHVTVTFHRGAVHRYVRMLWMYGDGRMVLYFLVSRLGSRSTVAIRNSLWIKVCSALIRGDSSNKRGVNKIYLIFESLLTAVPLFWYFAPRVLEKAK